MSDTDRAAKAARAKAMLKKRQQQKKAVDSATPSEATSASPSRTFSPAPPESPIPTATTTTNPPNAVDNRDINDIFDSRSTPNTNDSVDWFSSLPPTNDNPPPPSLPPSSGSQNGHTIKPSLDTSSADRIISNLESEKATLLQRISVLEPVQERLNVVQNRLSEEESSLAKLKSQMVASETEWSSKVYKEQALSTQLTQRLQKSAAELSKERSAVAQLGIQVAQLTAQVSTQAQEIQRLSHMEKELGEVSKALENANTSCAQLQHALDDLQLETTTALENERQTITFLVSEKAAMGEELVKFQRMEDVLQQVQESLEEERQRTSVLSVENRDLRRREEEMSKAYEAIKAEVKEVSEKSREQERQLQLSLASSAELKDAVSRHQSRVKELEEHIQSDDRAEKLEEALRNTQDRADELEFQLSKVKQTAASLRSERDTFEALVQKERTNSEDLKHQIAQLETQHASTQALIAQLMADKDAIVKEREALSQAHSQETLMADKAVAALKLEIDGLHTELSNSKADTLSKAQQLAHVQSDLKSANRRVDEAEQAQEQLQAEGSELLNSINEMRPKLVELTQVKLDLSERLAELEGVIHSKETATHQLEASLEVQRTENAELRRNLDVALAQKERDQGLAQQDTAHQLSAYKVLQDELASTQTSLRKVEADRHALQLEYHRNREELETLITSSQAQQEELIALRQQVEEDEAVQDEEKDFLNRSQDEVESLRQDLAVKTEEIERLREQPESTPRSLDDEMISSMRQQHAIDLSNAQSAIRALETSVFDAEARAHQMQKQVHLLQDQLARRSPLSARAFSPPPPLSTSRPSSRNQVHRPSSVRPGGKLDQTLDAATIHKRKISLAMLKARMDSELQPVVHVPQVTSHHHHHQDKETPVVHPSRRPQILDDSAVFWCHCCQGDLVQL